MSQIVTMPQLGETVTEGTILTWLVKVGDEIKEDDPIVEISTDKVDTEVPSPFSGTVSNLFVKEGDTVAVGTPLLELDGGGEGESTENKVQKEEKTEQKPESSMGDKSTINNNNNDHIRKDKSQKLSPIVRKLAKKNNVNLSTVTGSGQGGRITRKDIEAYVISTDHITENTEKQVKHKSSDERLQNKGEHKIPRLRKKIAENMVLSKQTSAHVMTSVEVDFEAIEQIRIENKEIFKKTEGFSLTYLPFVSRASVESLKEFPVVNSSFNLQTGKQIIHDEINLGIAVDLDQQGLLVGTVKSTDSYNLLGIARKISELSKLLRGGKHELEDISGSTFTISNNGSFNSYLTAPIINQPNVAILSAESVKKRAVVIEGADGSDSISIRHTGLLSLTWDHRVFDGSTALLFLNSVKDKLEKSNWKQELR